MNDFNVIAQELGQVLLTHQYFLAVAESCTGGWIAETITSIAGSSRYFDCGFVTYSNQSKIEMLGVKPASLEKFGAVSEQTAREMAEGVLARSHANVSLAVTGIAGPEGGTPEKPVGTVWFAWANKNGITKTKQLHISGDRTNVRKQSVLIALQGIIDFVVTN